MRPEPIRNPAWPLAVVGAVLALGGGALLVGLFVVVYGESALLSSYALRLGLAGTTLVSAIAQIAVFVGAGMVWRASRRRAG
jgi:alkylhydroperoxidase/carboxymuconolactone decarboxylase family protein YurZ